LNQLVSILHILKHDQQYTRSKTAIMRMSIVEVSWFMAWREPYYHPNPYNMIENSALMCS